MKRAKAIFAILFLAMFGGYCALALFWGLPGVLDNVMSAFPSPWGMEEGVNYALYSAMPGRTAMLEAHARLQLLAKRHESGGFDVVEATKGSYVNGHAADWQREDVEGYALQLVRLKQALADAGLDTQVMFISTQPQVVSGYTEPVVYYPLPEEAELEETMLYYLRGYNVDFLDVGLTLRESTLDPSEYIYRTDTKWTTQASFMVMRAMLGKMQDQYGVVVDPDALLFNMANYRFTTHEDVFMGTMGMAAGMPFTGREDFIAIAPTFDTAFTYEAQGDEARTLAGRFDQTLFNAEIVYPYDPYLYSSYSSYLDGGAYFQRKIVNEDYPDGAKVLYIHDASTLPLAAMLAPGFGETHMYWPGLAPGGAEFDLLDYVAKNGIEYVFFQGEANIYSLAGLFAVLP